MISQPGGYKAFVPEKLPPSPALRIEGALQNLLSQADMALARLDGMGYFPAECRSLHRYVCEEGSAAQLTDRRHAGVA